MAAGAEVLAGDDEYHFSGVPETRVISSTATIRGTPAVPDIDRRRSGLLYRHFARPHSLSTAHSHVLGWAQDSESQHISRYRLGRRDSNRDLDLSA